MLDAEAALARACAKTGQIPPAIADQIAAACTAERFEIAWLATEGARHVQPVVGLVTALREAVDDESAPYVHQSATSQDILDTALVLVAKRAMVWLTADLRAAADALAVLADEHARTPIVGRTLMQQAMPTTFGLKAAGWFSMLDGGRAGLERVTAVLPLQLGGPVGALHNPQLGAAMAAELGLVAPVLAWHGDRRPVAELAAALGVVSGVIAKLARDVGLMAQNEIGELREGGDGGGSSSMAHKRNPVASISATACALRAPGLVATLMAVMAGEHERAAGAWQAEWETLLELIRVTGSAASWAAELSAHLEVNVERMAAHLPTEFPPTENADAAAALVEAALQARQR